MKETYITPEMEIIEFENEDIITNSTPFEPTKSNSYPKGWIRMPGDDDELVDG